MADKERIAELLVEPNIGGMDFAIGTCILNNWKDGLPDRILALVKQLGYTHQPEQKGIVESLYNEVICPMCYRLNPQHETQDNSKGCHWCQEKQDWLDLLMTRTL